MRHVNTTTRTSSLQPAEDRNDYRCTRDIPDRDEYGRTGGRAGIFAHAEEILAGLDEQLVAVAHNPALASRLGF